MQQHQQDQALAALLVACEQPAFNRQVHVMCAAACTCSALRQAVRQCSNCQMAMVIRPDAPLERLHSFAQWLPKHAALVKSLCMTEPYVDPVPELFDGQPWEGFLAAGRLLLQLAVQLAAPQPAAAATAAGSAITQQQPQQLQQQQQRGLRLVSFSSNWRGSPQLLAALPAHSLTQLTLDLGSAQQGDSYQLDAAAAAAALARLSSLQQLTMQNKDCMCENAASCLAAVSELTQLTLLHLSAFDQYEGVWEGDNDDDEEVGPLELQALLPRLSQLRVLRLPTGTDGAWPPLDFSHMTQLQELTNGVGTGAWQSNKFDAGQQFPAQLRKLDFRRMRDVQQLGAVMQLQQLEGLTFLCELGASEPEQPDMVQLLQPLAKLPALQQLSITFDKPHVAAAVAAAWALLPQLSELTLKYPGCAISSVQWQAIITGLAAATSLTKLDLTAVAPRNAKQFNHALNKWEQKPGEAVAACGALAGLTKLLDLCISRPSRLVPGDALALSALTGLTRLVLAGAGVGVGDEAAAALVRSCQQLRHLDLSRCSLHSAACLPDVSCLAQLTQLRLEGNEGITRQGLMQLTGLAQLQQLGVDRELLEGDVTDEARRSFWLWKQPDDAVGSVWPGAWAAAEASCDGCWRVEREWWCEDLWFSPVSVLVAA